MRHTPLDRALHAYALRRAGASRERNFNEAVRQSSDAYARLAREVWLKPRWLKYQVRRSRESYIPALRGCGDRKALPVIAWELASVTLRWRCLPFHYLRYGLYSKSVPETADVLGYLPETAMYYRILPITNTHEVLLDDKLVFKRILAACGVPHPPTRIVIDRHQTSATSVDLRAAGTSSVVAKPARFGSGGRNIFFFDLATPDGPAALDAFVAGECRRGRTWLVEDAVDQADELARLHPPSLNTFRIMTWIGPRGAPQVMYTMLKMGVGGRRTDNAHTDGLYVKVDERGALAPRAWDEQHRFHMVHPNSGVPFAGIRLSVVPAVHQLALQCAELFPDCAFVGWDIAVGTTGPVVLEGNSSPGLTIIQRTHGGMAQAMIEMIAADVRAAAR